MRTHLLLISLLVSWCVQAQQFEMPSAKSVVKNKYSSLELVSAADSSYKTIASYGFDDKGRVVYEKTKHSSDVKPYYTVYTYDNKGRKSTATDRYEDGRFAKRIVYTWLKDSVRLEAMYLNPNDSNELSVKYWIGPPPYNVARRVVTYHKDGSERTAFGTIYDKKGKAIGGYDSIAETRTIDEYYYFRYRQIRTYDANGKLNRTITMRLDTAGLIVSLTDSVVASKTAQRFEITRSRSSGMVISKNNVPLTGTELSDWYRNYGDLRLGEAILPPVLAPLPPSCYSATPSYDATGLIRKAVINSICNPGMPGYPWTVLYRYSQ